LYFGRYKSYTINKINVFFVGVICNSAADNWDQIEGDGKMEGLIKFLMGLISRVNKYYVDLLSLLIISIY
jgi:hypothetical protein